MGSEKQWTALSVGLLLTIYFHVCDQDFVSILSTVHIGSNYQHILDLQKRVELAAQQQMVSTGEYCLPDFVK